MTLSLPGEDQIIWDSREERKSAKFWAIIGIAGIVVCIVTIVLIVFIWWPLAALLYSYRVRQRPEYLLSNDGVYVISNSRQIEYYHWQEVYQLQAAREFYEKYLLGSGHIFFSTGEMRKGHYIIGVGNPEQVVMEILKNTNYGGT